MAQITYSHSFILVIFCLFLLLTLKVNSHQTGDHASELGLEKSGPGNSSKCSFCVFLVSTIEQHLSFNVTETKIMQWLDAFCAKLPEPFGSQCKQIVDNDVPYIIHYIDEKYPANETCSLIHWC